MTALRIALLALGIGVLLLTVVYVLPHGGNLIARLHYLRPLVPMWNFFAPNPGTDDYHVLVRTGDSPDSLGSWAEASAFERPTDLRSLLWDPARIERKALFDLVQQLGLHSISRASEPNVDGLKLSVPYISSLFFALNTIHAEAEDSSNRVVQFMIMREDPPSGDMEVLFVSGLHSGDTATKRDA